MRWVRWNRNTVINLSHLTRLYTGQSVTPSLPAPRWCSVVCDAMICIRNECQWFSVVCPFDNAMAGCFLCLGWRLLVVKAVVVLLSWSPPTKLEGGYVFIRVCLFICLFCFCRGYLKKLLSFSMILGPFWGQVTIGLDFEVDPRIFLFDFLFVYIQSVYLERILTNFNVILGGVPCNKEQ